MSGTSSFKSAFVVLSLSTFLSRFSNKRQQKTTIIITFRTSTGVFTQYRTFPVSRYEKDKKKNAWVARIYPDLPTRRKKPGETRRRLCVFGQHNIYMFTNTPVQWANIIAFSFFFAPEDVTRDTKVNCLWCALYNTTNVNKPMQIDRNSSIQNVEFILKKCCLLLR